MLSFEPNKRYLRELLIYFFNLKKSAAEAHRMLVEAYGALSERSCREWFQKFKNGEFDEDKEGSGRPKVYEDIEYAELEALLDEDSCQTQKELALTLGVTQQTISYRLKSLRMHSKARGVPHELKPRNVERRFFTCEMLLVRHKRKGFLHRIVTDDEKWIHYDNPKKRKSWGPPGHASISTAKPNIHGKNSCCVWWDQLGIVYYELLKPNETITGALYRIQLMRLSRALREKRIHYSRHDKIILLHDNARPHVAAPVKTYSNGKFYFTPYSPDIAPSDYHLFR